MNRPINESFFDEESKEMWYVTGASFSRCSVSTQDNRNTWYGTSRDLLKIIQEKVSSDRKIGGPNKNGSYQYQLRSETLQDKLGERGLGVIKQKRLFPKNIPEQYLDHFIRGFFDAGVSVIEEPKNHNFTQVCFNITFLKELHKHLVKNASVKRSSPKKSPLTYSHADTVKVHDFIYRDWKFIQETGLYLPSKKDRFS